MEIVFQNNFKQSRMRGGSWTQCLFKTPVDTSCLYGMNLNGIQQL